QHREQNCRWILQVSIYDRHRVSKRVIDAGRNGRLMTEISRKTNQLDPRIALADFANNSRCSIATSIVDIDNFNAEVLRRPQTSIKLGVSRRNDLALVKARDDD